MKLSYASETHIGNVRASNQDALACCPDLGLFLIADGMGGHAQGEQASQLAITEVPRRFAALGGNKDAGNLPESIQAANRVIHAAGNRTTTQRRMGTTIVALEILATENRMRWSHVGDSRLYRLREGQLALLTVDHTRFGAAYTAIALPPPTDVPHTNQLVGALGIATSAEIRSGEDEILRNDRFLLCSDGISGMLPPEAIESVLANSKSCRATAERLIADALQAGGRDNASGIVLHLD